MFLYGVVMQKGEDIGEKYQQPIQLHKSIGSGRFIRGAKSGIVLTN